MTQIRHQPAVGAGQEVSVDFPCCSPRCMNGDGHSMSRTDINLEGPMSMTKIEFKPVAVIDCGKSTLPHWEVLGMLSSTKSAASSIVACTRARDHLMLSHSGAPSEFLASRGSE